MLAHMLIDDQRRKIAFDLYRYWMRHLINANGKWIAAKSIKICFAFFIWPKGDFSSASNRNPGLCVELGTYRAMLPHVGTSTDEYSVAKTIHLPKLRKHVKQNTSTAVKCWWEGVCVETAFHRTMKSEK